MPYTGYDVCIVGSGFGGGISAYALTQMGLKVALLEAGPRLRAGVDYGHHAKPWEFLEQRLQAGFASPVDSAWDLRERDHFTGVGDRPDHGWLRAVGGRSLCWAGHSLRFGPGDYKKWPISYDEVAPYYSRAEKFMGVYGYKDGLWNMPDGEFLKPVPMKCGEMMLKRGVDRLKKKGSRMEFVAQRKAMLTEPHASRRAQCHFCGKCGGCCVDAKYTSANTPIPAAMRTGRLTLLSDATMTRMLASRDGRRVTGVEFTNSKGATDRVEAKAFVLACNSIETPRQLLLNKLANSSGQVGKNLTSHFGIFVYARFPELAGRRGPNDEGTGYYHSLLTGLYWDQPSKDFEETYQVQCGAGLLPWRLVNVPRGFGASFKKALYEDNSEQAGMNMQGTLVQSPKKFVDLDPQVKDRFGNPRVRVHLHYEDNDIRMAQDCLNKCEEIIGAAGGRILSSPGKIDASKLIIDYNHWVGTTRMGTDARSSVVNTACQSHDIPNLFIGDASVFPRYPEKNPTLTNIALAWRMSDQLAGKMKRGELA